MPALRVDWQAIKGALADVSAPYVFVLPDGARQLFLATADQLSWEATFRAFSYDYSDWDLLQQVQAHGVSGLLGGIPLDELISYIDDIETLLQELIDKECCASTSDVTDIITDGDGGYIPGDDVGSDVERDVGDPPGDSETWEDWELALCANAAEFVDSLSTWVSNIENFRSWVSAGVITLTGAALGLVLAQAAAVGIIGTTLAGIVGGGVAALSFLDDLRDFFDTSEPNDAAALAELADPDIIEGLICSIINADTPAEAETAMDAYLSTYAPNAAGYITALPMRWFMNKAFSDEIDGSGFGGPCPDCVEPTGLFWLAGNASLQYNLGAGWVSYPNGTQTLPIVYGQEVLWQRFGTSGNDTVDLLISNGAGVTTAERTWESEYIAAGGNAVSHFGRDGSGSTTHASHNLFSGTTETGVTMNRSTYGANAIRNTTWMRLIITA